MTRTRLLTWAPVVIAVATAAGIGWKLWPYHLPMDLWTACVASVLGALTVSLGQAAALLQPQITYRCRHCAFTVRLTFADAVENRRWQEAAQAHPTHLPPR
ncbi:hypothetical protein [Streptomyces cacaoi]|uniref:hypothetical protein n=1 Tax=Streptomyces cacaoi TaxID=1898 RepID=UPI00261222A8|nr:hypothetical protein [Streptomyces cacaoi]